MRIAVCDDSSLDRELIAELLCEYFSGKRLPHEIVPYQNGAELLCDVEEDRWFDIVLLDIYMGNLLGIDVARKLRASGYEGEIIFLTASADYAVDSYDVDAAGYLLKPVSVQRLYLFMDRILQDFEEEVYQIRQRSKITRVPYREILFVESSNSKCILHREPDRQYVIYKRLSEIETELNDRRFLRCHQSYLVNMDFIQLADKSFTLLSGDEVLIRRRDLKTIRQTYLDYVAGKDGTLSL